MTITYPISFPTVTGVMSVNWRAVRADALSMSPTSFAQQVIQHQGQRWEADITIPPLDRADAEQFVAFLLQLDGRKGTFLFTPPEGATPRGSAGGTPVINGASQTGDTLAIDGLTVSTTNYLMAGDYIQLGSGSTARLHKVVADVDSDGSGAATLDIWPKLRESPADGATVVVTSAAGLFRLAGPEVNWAIESPTKYGITFSIIEAL